MMAFAPLGEYVIRRMLGSGNYEIVDSPAGRDTIKNVCNDFPPSQGQEHLARQTGGAHAGLNNAYDSHCDDRKLSSDA